MPGLQTIKKQHFITLLLLLLVYAGSILCSGYSKSKTVTGVSFSDSVYAGSASCITCHKAIYDSFIGTAHYLTSRPAAAEFIKGSFDRGQNYFS
jgi:hypothetical protein